MATDWNPQQYHRFQGERRQPFDDLVALMTPVPGGRVLDLGCGTGELTADLHRALAASETLGVDTSSAMLERARPHAGEYEAGRVGFQLGDLADVEPDGSWDVVAANASLHWLPDHPRLLGRLAGALRPGGQLAVQVPANWDHPSHTVASELGRPLGVPDPPGAAAVLPPERYAQLLHDLGFAEQVVRLQVYGHELGRTADVVEWVRGTLLTHYRRHLTAEQFAAFLDRYRARLLPALGDPAGDRPYFYPFKRVLLWARRPATGRAAATRHV